MNKKVNAVLGLTIIVLFLIHIMYEIYAYLTFYYNPVLTKIIAYSALAVTGLHVLCSIYTVYVSHDKGRGMKYPALNIRTLLQRISAVMIVVLMIISILRLCAPARCRISYKCIDNFRPHNIRQGP